MISKDIEVVQKLARDLVDIMPHDITVNSKGEFFSGGGKVDTMVLLAGIEDSRAKAVELQHILQEKLEGRKARKG